MSNIQVTLSDHEIVKAILKDQQGPLMDRVTELQHELNQTKAEIDELYDIHGEKLVEILKTKYSHELECLQNGFGDSFDLDFDNINKLSSVATINISSPSIVGYITIEFNITEDELKSMDTYAAIKIAENTFDQIRMDVSMVNEEIQILDDKADSMREDIKRYALNEYKEMFVKENREG